MRLEPVAPHCVVEPPCEEMFVYVPPEDEDQVFRMMRRAYLDRHIQYNGCMVTLQLCESAFHIPRRVLRGRQRTGGLGGARAKLIAFSHVVAIDQPCINSIAGIGRAFHRTHASVIYCINRYGPQIAAALEQKK